MKTKTDIQFELLNEIDEICSKNNLNYILFEIDGKNPFHNVKKEQIGFISIAMTQGDIDRFCKIIEEEYSQNRYVEGMFNNSKYTPLYVSYGNRNTTDIKILELSHNIHYGIHIIIHPINKSAKLDGTKIEAMNPRLSKEKKIRQTLNKRIENPRFWYVKTGLSVANGVYSLTGGGKRYYNSIKKNIAIDKWEDIQSYSEVSINGFDIIAEELKELEKIKINEIPLFIAKGCEDFFTRKIKEKLELESKTSNNLKGAKIIDTEIGYEEVFKQTNDIITGAKAANEEVAWRKLKVSDELKTVKRVWELVEMTNLQVQFIHHFEKDDKLYGLDLNDKNQFNEAYKELKPVITELKRYAKLGMTFTIDDKTDKMIDEILLRKGEGKLLEKIKVLREKEYFIE